MRTIFYLAGGLLSIAGVLLLARLLLVLDLGQIASVVLVGLLGVAYLVVGVGLIRQREAAVRWGLILPLVGLLVSLFGLGAGSDPYTIALIAIEVMVIGMIGYIMVAGRGLLGRV